MKMNPTGSNEQTRQEAFDMGNGISIDLRTNQEMLGSDQQLRYSMRLRPEDIQEERTDRDRTRDRIRRMPGISDAFWRGYTGRERREEREE